MAADDRAPEAVVVDHRDGHTWYKDTDGVLFTYATAFRFTEHMNEGRDSSFQTFEMFTLDALPD